MAEYVIPDSAKESPEAFLAWCAENGVEELDARFVDIRGMVEHFSMPLAGVDADMFEEGLGFDGSSVQGYQSIEVSDMILIPDLSSALIDPFFEAKTAAFYCYVYDPITREPYTRDPRGIIKRAAEYLPTTGLADTCFMGPEAEFFIFTDINYDVSSNMSYYEVDSHEGFWNSGTSGTRGYLNRIKEGYFPLPPNDQTQDLRALMVKTLMAAGMEVEVHHHEVGGAAQAEIDLRFENLSKIADTMTTYKYIVKNVAHQNGFIATFMPKPIHGDNGSGMHTHQSLWKDGDTLFAGDEYAGLSKMAMHYMAGILAHAKSILAFAAPTSNSYRRLIPGYEAPVNLVYSNRNRSAAIRIPMYSNSPKAKRIEFRSADPTANPYFAFAAMLMAGLDGIKNELDPGEAAEVDLFEGEHDTPYVPGSLMEAIEALEADHEYLLEGGVFTQDMLDTYIAYKKKEAKMISEYPHPIEFKTYIDL
jgi:glutamine synthetase